MPTFDRPFAFMCSCGQTWSGRPAYYKAQAHAEATGHPLKNRSTNQSQGKKRRLG